MIEDESREVGRATVSREAPAPVSVAQRQAIVSLLSDGLSRSEVAAKIGVTPGQVSAIKAHVSMGTYREDADALAAVEAENEVAGAFDTVLGLERDLQLALRRSIERLEPGLTVIDDNSIVAATPKRKRGRPSLADKPGERHMVHLQPETAARLREIGDGSISRAVMRLIDAHEGVPLPSPGPPPRTVKQIKDAERMRRRAQEALDVINQMLNEKFVAGTT